MRHTKPTLSIIILAYNEEKYITPCIEAVKNQTIPAEEVIVVNNNSIDKTAEIASTYSFVTLINQKEQGMIPSRDTGFNVAHGDLLARIDADTQIPPKWVETVHALIDSHANEIYGISGPQYFYAVHNCALKKIATEIFSRFGFFTVSRIMLGHETLFGSNMIITKRAWQKVRGEVCHDDKKVHEDIDLAIHIGEYGAIAYNDKLIVGISSRALLENPRKHLWRISTWIKTITNHRKLFIGPS